MPRGSTGRVARRVDWLVFWSIPVFTAVIGILINWTGLVMLFSPVRFHGATVPGLREVSSVLPHTLQGVPGLVQGGIGWQGIIPARAAKVGLIAVDKEISKLGVTVGTVGELARRVASGVPIPEAVAPRSRLPREAAWSERRPTTRLLRCASGGRTCWRARGTCGTRRRCTPHTVGSSVTSPRTRDAC